jgi:hypothetical protein
MVNQICIEFPKANIAKLDSLLEFLESCILRAFSVACAPRDLGPQFLSMAPIRRCHKTNLTRRDIACRAAEIAGS